MEVPPGTRTNGFWYHETVFLKHVIKHRFCQTCGIHPYGEGTDPNGNRMAAINIRCLEGIDLESVPVQHFDGRSL